MAIKAQLKHFLLQLSGKYSHLRKGLRLEHEWYGNDYGGFYLHPNLVNEASIVYSFGIGEDLSFDQAVMARHQCRVYGFDPTPKSINWVRGQNLPENFRFFEVGISPKNDLVDFFLPSNPEYVSGSLIEQKNTDSQKVVQVEVKTLETIMTQLGHKHIDVLKMDIEWAEYDVIENILSAQLPITQILIEFHDRCFVDGMLKTKAAVKALKQNGYKVYAVSESFEEVSFIKADVLKAT